jgi:transcription antitermination protein NusB
MGTVTAKSRRQARVIALQALYELDCTQHKIEEVMRFRLEDDEEPVSHDTRQFAFALVNGVLAHRSQLDTMIQQFAPEWPLGQIAIVDRNILRIAIFEFSILGETPVKVAINEAVELAKTFGSESASRFINGVLGALAANLKEADDKESDKLTPNPVEREQKSE